MIPLRDSHPAGKFPFWVLAIIDVPASVMLFYWFFTQLFSGTVSLVSVAVDVGGVAFLPILAGLSLVG